MEYKSISINEKRVGDPDRDVLTLQEKDLLNSYFNGVNLHEDVTSEIISIDAPHLEQNTRIIKCGPWGSSFSPNWKMDLADGETIREVIIRCGFIVDGIGFNVANRHGETTTRWFGGYGGILHRIPLMPNEYITQIRGRHGIYEFGLRRHIGSISIHTNLCPEGYGPYGSARCTENIGNFSTPLPSGCAIAGFFGRTGKFLDSIGVNLKMAAAGSAWLS